MSNGNGNRTWTVWMAGVLATGFTGALMLIGNNVIANDKDARARDEKIQEQLVSYVQQQQQTNQTILVSLQEIKTDIKYIKKYKDKDGN